MLGAIVIVAPENREEVEGGATPIQQGTPLVCAEVLGRSVVGRMVEEFRRAGIELTSVIGNISSAPACAGMDSAAKIDLCSPEEAWQAATQQLLAFKQSGVEGILVVRAGAYVDLDLKEALQFHRENGQIVTRAFDKEGPLDIWIIDPSGVVEGMDILSVLGTAETARYMVRGYVNRLGRPRDLRRLAADGLTARCRLRPQGKEIRPGVWMDEGAHVHRDARIVAPAFIGRGARVAEQCLITRCSSIEGNSHVDYGTVVEDSSILSNSYVGIGLDLAHSIVDGNNLLNLERDVIMEVSDPRLIRENRVQRRGRNRQSPVVFGLAGARFAPAEEGSR